MLIIRAAAILLGAGLVPAQAQQALYRWVQYVPGGIEARAVTTADSCPQARIDGAPAAMRLRAAPGPDYPIRVCALTIPASAANAAIDGAALVLPKLNPARVLLIGDTGCRITDIINQGCNEAEEWPFAPGAVVEAGLKPDLTIHVGDFHYRESGCRPFNKACAGSPHGDSWAVWEADFFKPAKPLLEASPFVFVRGNHEECERGGKGWSRTLDPYPFTQTEGKSGCLGQGAPYVADLGSPKLVVMDVSTATELRVNAKQAEAYRQQFASIASLAPAGPVWVTFHRPIWAVGGSALGFVLGDNKTLAAAARETLPANVQALLSGHIHTFQALSYEQDLPVQIVSGHGGDELHTSAPANPTGLEIDGVKVRYGIGRPGVFGFVLLERAGGDWRMTNHDMAGKILDTCRIEGRALGCQ